MNPESGYGDVAHRGCRVKEELVRTRFVCSLITHCLKPEVLAIHRNMCSSVMAQAREHSFHIFARAVAKLRGGNANLKFAWHDASSKGEINDIVQHSFGHAHSNGLRLSLQDSPLERRFEALVAVPRYLGEDGGGSKWLLLDTEFFIFVKQSYS